MSYTVWSYAHDAAVHHDNELVIDTFDCFKQAMQVARQRCSEAKHNTAYSKVVDNDIAGHMGDSGGIALFRKLSSGGVRRAYVREPYKKLMRKSAITNEGLLALYDPEKKVWEYFRQSGRGGAALTCTGSTKSLHH